MYRKFLSLRLSALLLILLTFPSGCGDDGTSPPPGGFSFKLTVVDQSGAPISDLKLSRRCRIEYPDLPSGSNQALMPPPAGTDVRTTASFRPGIGQVFVTKSEPGTAPLAEFVLHPAKPNPGISTSSIKLDIGGVCYLEVAILNWKDEELYRVSAQVTENVTSVVLRYVFGNLVDYVPNGIFQAVFIATEPDTSTVLFEDSVYFSGYTDNDPFRQLIGHTSTDGSFSTTDKGYFPSLQGHQPQMGYTTDGVEVGLFSFSDTLEVKAMTEVPPDIGGVVYWMTRELVISDGSNGFKWVFVPDDSLLVIPRQ